MPRNIHVRIGVLAVAILLLLAACSLSTTPVEPTPTPEPLPYLLSDPVRLSSTSELEENWASLCAKDGKLLISESNREAGSKFLYAVGILENGRFTRLTKLGTGFEFVKPSWNRDCTQFTYERLEGTLTNVYVMNADGSDERQAINRLTPDLHLLAPSFAPDSNRIVATVSECTICVPEDTSSNTRFAIINLDDGGSAYIFDSPPQLGWGFMHNARFAGSSDAIIFNVNIAGKDQIGVASGLDSQQLVWTQLTDDASGHFRPVWLQNGAFLYTSDAGGHSSIWLSYKGQQFDLTRNWSNACKDADVIRIGDGFQMVATCKSGSDISDFFSWQLTLR